MLLLRRRYRAALAAKLRCLSLTTVLSSAAAAAAAGGQQHETCSSATVLMRSGFAQPTLGLGVYQSPGGGVTAQAVQWAIEDGYRHIDTATLYKNEDEVGKGVRASGVERGELFITSKLWVMGAHCKTAAECESWAVDAVAASLKRAELDYFDLYLVHSPHQPFAGARLAFWRGLEQCVELGRLRSIGVSNFGERHLQELLDGGAAILPTVNQIEIHPWLQHRALARFCAEHSIVVQAYSPLARAQKFGGASPELAAIAKQTGRTEAQVLIRWSLQKGYVPLPKSIDRARIRSNAEVFEWELDAAAMESLDGLEAGLVTIWEPMADVA